MNLTLSELLQTLAAMPSMLLLFLPPGYLLGRVTQVEEFSSRSGPEQLVWSTALSLPVSLVLTNVVARFVPSVLVLGLLLVLDGLCLWQILRAHPVFVLRPAGWRRSTQIVVGALCLEALYICFAGLPLQLGRTIYEPVFSSDWEIRLPAIMAAVRDGIPPHNPFFTFGGQSPAMHYYYYWYSICAEVVRVLHVGSRSALLASSLYAALGIIATLYLYLKYLLPSDVSLRRRCIVLLGLLCVLSLDVLPSILGLFTWRIHLRPEIEWWSQDRSPGLPAAVLYAPHHVAGAACGLLAFLVASLLTLEATPASRKKVLVSALIVGLAMTGLVGTSSFITLFFALGLLFLGADRLFHRDFHTPVALVLAGLLSLTLSMPFLHEMASRTVAVANPEAGKHALALSVRDYKPAQFILYHIARLFHRLPPGGHQRFAYRGVVMLLLYFCETGFFSVIFVLQFWTDFRSGRPLTQKSRCLWLLTLAIGLFGMFVTSAPIQFVNDLGVHAGLMFRIILTLWGTQIVSWYLGERRRGRVWAPWQIQTIRFATLLLILGVITFVWQAAVERIYLVLLDRHVIPSSIPFPQSHHLAAMYGDIHDAEQSAGKLLPPNAVIQSNPASRYQTIFRLYEPRRQAAGDLSCEGAFGGDPNLCHMYAPAILKLYGGRARFPVEFAKYRADPANMTAPAFQTICTQTGLSAMLATPADPAWYYPQSWVWQEPVLYANKQVRVLRCPSA